MRGSATRRTRRSRRNPCMSDSTASRVCARSWFPCHHRSTRAGMLLHARRQAGRLPDHTRCTLAVASPERHRHGAPGPKATSRRASLQHTGRPHRLRRGPRRPINRDRCGGLRHREAALSAFACGPTNYILPWLVRELGYRPAAQRRGSCAAPSAPPKRQVAARMRRPAEPPISNSIANGARGSYSPEPAP